MCGILYSTFEHGLHNKFEDLPNSVPATPDPIRSILKFVVKSSEEQRRERSYNLSRRG